MPLIRFDLIWFGFDLHRKRHSNSFKRNRRHHRLCFALLDRLNVFASSNKLKHLFVVHWHPNCHMFMIIRKMTFKKLWKELFGLIVLSKNNVTVNTRRLSDYFVSSKCVDLSSFFPRKKALNQQCNVYLLHGKRQVYNLNEKTVNPNLKWAKFPTLFFPWTSQSNSAPSQLQPTRL